MPEVANKENIEIKRKRRKRSSFLSRAKKKRKLEPVVTTHEKCCFCHSGPNKKLGNFFQDCNANLAAHQFCLLFSAGLPQLGDDKEGFEGFLFQDIIKEVQRVSILNCKFCGKPGANAGCCVSHCKTLYHYHCGLKEGLQFIFSGSFDTYCCNHRSYQDLSHLQIRGVKSTCPICLENVKLNCCGKDDILKTPCCKNVFMHKSCVQRQATVSGYFFRCPCCNNKEDFNKEMASYGIYIPSRDAAWEERDAFVDLLQEYNKCDMKKCICERGRKYSTMAGKWHLIRCYLCGQSAVHVKCLGKHYIPGIGYVCLDCNKIARHTQSSSANIVQPVVHERLKEHKRRLQELTSRDDPVLLASCVFGKRIWCKKFNIKDCNVNLYNLNIPSKTTKITQKQLNELLEKQLKFETDRQNKRTNLKKDSSNVSNANLLLPECIDKEYDGSDFSANESTSKNLGLGTCNGNVEQTPNQQSTMDECERDRISNEDESQLLIKNSFEILSIKLCDYRKLDKNNNLINDEFCTAVNTEDVYKDEDVSIEEQQKFGSTSLTEDLTGVNTESFITSSSDNSEGILKDEQKEVQDATVLFTPDLFEKTIPDVRNVEKVLSTNIELKNERVESMLSKQEIKSELKAKNSDSFSMVEKIELGLGPKFQLNVEAEGTDDLKSELTINEINPDKHEHGQSNVANVEKPVIGSDSKLLLNEQKEETNASDQGADESKLSSNDKKHVNLESMTFTHKFEQDEGEKKMIKRLDQQELEECKTNGLDTKDNKFKVFSKKYENIIVKMLDIDPSDITSRIEFSCCPTPKKDASIWNQLGVGSKFEEQMSQDQTLNTEAEGCTQQFTSIVEMGPTLSEVNNECDMGVKESDTEDLGTSDSSDSECDDAVSEAEADTNKKKEDEAKITAAILREVDALFLPSYKKRRYVCRNFLGSHLVHRYHIPKALWIRAKLHQMAYNDTEIQIVRE